MMSGLSPFILRSYIIGYLFVCSSAWRVMMPSHLKGLVGSCLVIPCRFDYNKYPPQRPDRVVWYQYVSRGYPLVYDDWHPTYVIDIFRGKTQAYRSGYGKTCSLKIEPLTWSHHRQKLYPWVDPENIGKSTHEFYDTTVMIEVVDTVDPPNLQIYGAKKVGHSVDVHCSVYHTCPTKPPTLSLNIPHGNQDRTVELTDGTFKTTLKATLLIENDSQRVVCSVRYPTGHTKSTSSNINAECSILPLTISSTSNEFLEGYPSKVICTATYTCSKHRPTLTWSYGNMPTSTATTKEAQWKTVSTLTFTSSANDQGRSLTCYAVFSNGERQETSITLQVKRNMLSRGWSFSTPSSLTGLKGSCIVIPCKFTYDNNKPSDLRVLWFLYQSNQYPAVFNPRTSNVISKYNGITSLVGSVAENNCSLKIERLEMSHNQDRIYPWIDKNPITSYHTMGHTFYDKTTQLTVEEHAQEPQLSISGIPRVGEQSTVSCSVRHTCLSAPPTLTLNGVTGTDNMVDTLVSDGIWERTLERSWTVEEENQNVKCTVSYPTGGQTAASELPLNVECPYEEIKMVEPPGETTEGVAKSVICSVTYKCKKNTPTIRWNYEEMQSSLKTKKMPDNKYTTVSNLTFIGSMDDDGKPLTCTAKFVSGETSDSASLHIKKYEKPVDPHENDTFSVLVADVPFRFSALPRSCVVIPCSFQHEQDEPMTRGIWSKKKGGVVYHNGQSHVLDHFKGRTRMLGNLNEGNCSLEIDDIKPFDNGPFCFHAEKGDDQYRFNNSCVFVVMKASPGKPEMTTIPAEVDADSTLTVSCSVTHTCPSHAPQFSWSVPSITSDVSHTLMSGGVWQTTSTITFRAAGVRNLTCTATFWPENQQASTVQLNVKEPLSFTPVIAVPLVVLILIILAVVLGVFICRRRRHTEDSMKPPPRPEKRRSMWDRLSRRYAEDRERPPRPEKRRSLWSRFSRNSFWSRFSRRQDNVANVSVGYLNNTNTVITHTHGSKPRFPSPKNNRKKPHNVRPEDYQLYSNM
ncbi:uncharacterized protein LOC125015854 isoform X2 [Mugil cephalus]|uniref:uncharacterized protein LOC125015854 isoform X2 n=1 Tax=Mugil cephalus TaxID=48193 RepID=UPI001FB850CD|nr:uncharacterized protein LOC125015854 isoform X2 [Mugil cephalus]